ncbi:hypothetical protein PNP85_05070 [Halobacterium salinarum]|nr:hypothetical protein [Halobacterium salinarum]MDL0138871.1 hypothetical protein [Halobacterium salinarum]
MGEKRFRAELDSQTWTTLKKAKAGLGAETNPELVNKLLEEAGFDDE